MFAPNSDKALEVLVQGKVAGQDVENYFVYRAESSPSGPGPDDSQLFLLNFSTAWQAMLVNFYDVYSVSRYWLRQIDDVLVTSVGPPAKFRTVYAEDYDYIDGGVLDVGQIALGANVMLPTHEALRCRKVPANYKRGYFRGNYNRLAPFATADLKTTTHDVWADALVTSKNTDLAAFLATAIFGQLAGNGWLLGLWSANLFGRIYKPVGLTVRQSVQKVFTFRANKYVGTQTTRRYKTTGAFRGS